MDEGTRLSRWRCFSVWSRVGMKMKVPGNNLRQNLGPNQIVVVSKLAVLYAESIAPERDIADGRILSYVVDVNSLGREMMDKTNVGLDARLERMCSRLPRI